MSFKEISQVEKEVTEDKSPLPSASPIGDTSNAVLTCTTNESHNEKVDEKKINDTRQDDEKSKSKEKSQKLVDKDDEDDYEDDFDSDTDESSKSSNELPSDDDLSPSSEDIEITKMANNTKPTNAVPGKSCLALVPSSGRNNEEKKTVSFREALEDVRYYKIDDCPSKAGKGYFMSPFHLQEL
uniref:transcription initiation factor TFIID subunit 11-like n=1 Tax=Styela clava TaxID=7725 RepID=UPI00193A1719|nr:transcription initiation factor TFIID subunit 11-like [Styela clava]